MLFLLLLYIVLFFLFVILRLYGNINITYQVDVRGAIIVSYDVQIKTKENRGIARSLYK
jgi:hypothetical protein